MDEVRFTELVALYSLGALDEADRCAFEQYLRTAPAHERRAAQEFTEVAALLPLALPPVAAPPQLKARLMERISAEEELPFRPAKVLEFTPRPKRWSFFDLFAWQPVSGLLAAATLLLVGTSGWLWWQNSRVTRERDQLRQEVATLARANVATQAQLDQLITQTTRFVSLAGKEAPQATAKVFWDTTRNEWVVYILNLPAAPPDKDYQLWYITSDQQKHNAKVFGTNAQGRAELRVVVPPNVALRLAATAVTLERKGGAEQPTSGLYLVGTVGA